MSLQLERLVYRYPEARQHAVDEVDLALGGGELVLLLGPNGAGKTTLLRLVSGLLRPREGRVLLDGKPLDELGARARARLVAVVPQGLRALPDVVVEDFVLGGRYAQLGPWRRARAGDRERVRRALQEADVAELGGRLLTQLSGGQRQRVLVARALAQEARLVLVDEPTSSLDPEHQLAAFELFERLVGEGRAVLCVTHDLNLASQFATRVGLMRAGKLVASGTPTEVLRPDVLTPVYGASLRYGSWPGRDGSARPFVLPWREGRALREAREGREGRA